jgi:hypothetical protein
MNIHTVVLQTHLRRTNGHSKALLTQRPQHNRCLL